MTRLRVYVVGFLLLVLGLVMAHGLAVAQTTDWAALIRAAKPAVVWILAETREGTSFGSGAIISPDGYILTAAHVIEGATRIKVVVEETREFWASVVNADYKADVAVLKISASGLTWFALGDSDKVAIEDQIRVLGYPLPGAGVGLIAVAGVIQGTRIRGGVRLLQHNAATAAGHSGGPVINAQGQVIGVHSARFMDQPEYRVAVAVNEAKRLIPWGALPTGPSPVRPVGPTAPVAIVRVPQDQPTLTAAVRAAAEGAEIQIGWGTYRGDVSITKPLTITGESGAVIEGTVRISATRNVTLTGLQIRGGVEIRDTTAFTLDRIVVTGSTGDGILVEASTGVITGCTVEDAKGAGIVASFGARITVTKTAIRRSAKAGISLTLNSQARIIECTIEQNRGDGITVAGSTADIQDNVIRDNARCGVRADAASALTGSVTSANVGGNQGGNLCGKAINLDLEPPTITARLWPQPNANGWNNTDVQVTFECADPLSGIASCSGPRTFVQEGVHEATCEAVDKAGNQASVTVKVNIDRTAPTGSFSINDGTATTSSTLVRLRISAADALSGVAEVRFSNDGRTWSPWERFHITRSDWDLTAYGGVAREGSKTVYAQLRDRAGNVSSVLTATITLIPSPNPLSAPQNLRVTPSQWTNSDSFVVDWSDPPQVPPRVAAWYKFGVAPERPDDGTRTVEKPFRVRVTEEGEHLLYVWLEDETGRRDHRSRSSVILRYDKTPPQITVGSPQGTLGVEGWYRSDVTISFVATDNLSGFAPDGRLKLEGTRTSSGEGAEIRVRFSLADMAGNTAWAEAGPFKIDKTKPTITAEPDRPPDRDGWYNRDVTIRFRCSDALSGIAGCSSSTTVTREGRDQTIEGEAVDKAGNRATTTIKISLDKTPPTGSLTINEGAATTTSTTVTLRVSASDNLSGVAEMRFSNDGKTWSDWESFSSTRSWDLTQFGGSEGMGPKTVFGQLRDRAGNVSPTFSGAIRLLSHTLSGHTGSVRSVAFSPDGKIFASGSWDDTIKLWDVATGTLLRTLFGHERGVISVAFSPDGKILASGSGDQTIKLWDVATGTLLRTLTGHIGDVDSVAFSPDGKVLASGSWDGTIKLWDVATGKELRTLTGHTAWVFSVAFSPDGKTIASGSWDGTIKLWDVATGKKLRTLSGHTWAVTSVAFSPDGKTIASGSWDKTIKLWDVATGTLLRTLAGHTASVRSVAFSPDGRTLASGSYNWTIKLWDVARGTVLHTLSGHTGEVRSVAFSPNGRILASGSDDRTIKLWDVATGTLLRTLSGYTHWVLSVAFSPDGKTLASGSDDKTIKLWDVTTGTVIRTLPGHTGSVFSVAFSPDGRTLASGSYQEIKLWDVATGTAIRTLSGHTSWVFAVAFSPDGKTLASGSKDKTVKLWDVARGTVLRTLSGHTDSVLSVAFSPDGKTIASGSWDKTIKLWDVAKGTLLRTLTGHTYEVLSVAFSPDGKTIASGSKDKTVRLWDIATGEELRTLSGPMWIVTSVAFSPDGKTIASGSIDSTPTRSDYTIKLWDVATGTLLRTLAGHTASVRSVAFSPDGRTLASGSYQEIRLWDVATGKELRTLSDYTWAVTSVAFSPDGKTLAFVSGEWDRTIKLWDVATGTILRTLSGHTSPVLSVAFSPDGRTLASGSADRTIKLWHVATGTFLRTLSGYDEVRSVAFSPDGKTLASILYRAVILWDVATGRMLRVLGYTDAIRSMAFSPDGRTLASGSYDRTIKLWDVATGTLLRTLSGHTGWVESVAFSPDGKILASGADDKTIKLWDVATGTLLRTLTGHTGSVFSVAFSPDGKTLASGAWDMTIKLWDVATGKEIRTLSGLTGWVFSIAFSPDGRTLASGSNDWTIKLWDVATGRLIRTLTGHTNRVVPVTFSPDGKFLASGSWDCSVRLWDVSHYTRR